MAKAKEEFKVLDWLRAVRDKNYEEWRKDPLNFYKKQEQRARNFERGVAELAKKERAKSPSKCKTKLAQRQALSAPKAWEQTL